MLLDKEASLPDDDEINDYNRPLRPLHAPQHVARYRDIDGFVDQFGKFKRVFGRPDAWHTRGHLFVVTGDSGFGKTSLRQRCAYWMAKECEQEHCEVVVVDLSDEGWKGVTSDKRLSRMRKSVLDELRWHLSEQDLNQVANDDDIEYSFHKLGSMLKMSGASGDNQKPVVVVVLLPEYPKVEEIERYYGLAREGMVFLAEIFNPGDIEIITEKIDRRRDPFDLDRVDAHVLRLSELNPGDEEKLAKWLQNDLADCPSLEDIMVALGSIVTADRKVSAAEFLKMLTGVVGKAIEKGSNAVTWNDIMDYFFDDKFGHA